MADEKKDKLTIYQQLNKFLNLGSIDLANATPIAQGSVSGPSPKEDKIIIKGMTPEEIHRKGLELEQKRELQNKFFRTTDRGFQKALQYEAARLPAYIDYEGMEFYPIISSALDLLMEESTTIGMNGKMLNIYSNKDRIKSLLEEFFYDVVNVNVNLPFWVRNLPIKHDSIIPLLNGEEITIKELSERLKNNPNDEIWTYSIQDHTKKIVAGKVIWCDLTRENSEILKVTFDDGTYIETTPDHEYLLRNGTYVRADELKEGISLMPFYTLTSCESNGISGYEKVYNPSTNHHSFTHRIIAKECIVNSKEESGSYAISKTKQQKKELETIINHKVLSIERIVEKHDVYCMEVVGKNGEQDRHNFPVCSKNEKGEYTRNGVFVSNCKYGDNFVLLYGERKGGITHVKQMVNYEIERFERIQNGKPLVKFKERMTGDEFNVFEIAHFRLLGDDKFLPYGSSILNKVRRVFRQLCLDSNTKIWTPSGYTLIKNINVGDTVFSYDHRDKTVVKSNVKNVIKTGIKERFKVKTNHREIILTDNHPLLIKNNLEEYSYNNINNILNEKLILPTIITGNDSFKIKLSDDDYSLSLNERGKLSAKNIKGVGIIDKLKKLNCQTTIKNLHSFLRDGNRSIKYSDYIKLMNVFDLTMDDVDIYYFNSRVKPIVNKNLEFNINGDFIKLFGFMLGDGWMSNIHHTVGFALGIYEDENEYYVDLCKNIGDFKYTITPNSDSRGGQVNFYSHELYNIFTKLGFKTGAFNKRIPDWVYSLSYDNKIKFIKGMMDADGCDSNKLYSSSNYDLITDLKFLCQTCNIQVGKIHNDNRVMTNFKGKFSPRKISYSLYINIKDMISEVNERILSIENVGEDEVWDIEVDNELHNFIADGVVVHNCMAEDAMLTYRIIRAGEKKVFKIDVGNIDEDDIENYIYKVATKFKKTSQVAPNDGQIDYRFNILGNDEDYFLPVRNANTQTGIETLPGATNLNDIMDIEYLRDNLFMGLGIPKPFLSFQDAAGAGKSMAQYDIRFSKKVNRIQQAIIQELNKMAMIHLYLLGYTGDDLKEFTLTLTNPSTQQELLKSELLRDKAQTYTELTRAESGIAAMSHTTAKRTIFNMSDREIVEDLKQQKMEKVIMQELQDSPVTIKKSGLFADIDKKYGAPEGTMVGLPAGGAEQGGMPPVGGAEQGGMPPAGGAPEAGGQIPPPIPGLPNQSPGELPPVVGDGVIGKSVLTEKEYGIQIEKLVYGSSHEPEHKREERRKEIIYENDIKNTNLNSVAFNMVNEIDALLKESESINTIQKINEGEDVEIEDIENLDV